MIEAQEAAAEGAHVSVPEGLVSVMKMATMTTDVHSTLTSETAVSAFYILSPHYLSIHLYTHRHTHTHTHMHIGVFMVLVIKTRPYTC
jgi:hypothetical protein